jgi:hypothetical protein
MQMTTLLAQKVSAHLAILRVDSDSRGTVKVITQKDRPTLRKRVFVLPPEPGQVGIDSVEIAADRFTAGWLILYADPDGGTPDAGKLVIWRDGHVVRRFTTGQVFWSWCFQDGGRKVAYHVGPTHGSSPHFELRDVQTGDLLAAWKGDLENRNRPSWTKGLLH